MGEGRMRPPKRRCENCRYWDEGERCGTGRSGFCVRYPPAPLTEEGPALAPETGALATCGEWAEDDGLHRWRPPKGER